MKITVHYYTEVTEKMKLAQLQFGKFYLKNEGGKQYLVEILG